jgi:hypothetical protein
MGPTDSGDVEEVDGEVKREGPKIQREEGNEATRQRGNEATRQRGNEATRQRGNKATRHEGKKNNSFFDDGLSDFREMICWLILSTIIQFFVCKIDQSTSCPRGSAVLYFTSWLVGLLPSLALWPFAPLALLTNSFKQIIIRQQLPNFFP